MTTTTTNTSKSSKNIEISEILNMASLPSNLKQKIIKLEKLNTTIDMNDTQRLTNDDECDCDREDSENSSENNYNNRENLLSSSSSSTFLENIKRCPKCSILIERADGCAQVMCKICKHTFCFYCLKSLENDFLLKHYTKNGPCKGKLGHSRLSLFMHRISVIAIFSGTILLVVILSPFILLSLPCLIFSSKCRKTCYKFSTKFG